MRLLFQFLMSISLVAAMPFVALSAWSQDSVASEALSIGGTSESWADFAITFGAPCVGPGTLSQMEELLCSRKLSLPLENLYQPQRLRVSAVAAVVMDQREWRPLYAKEADVIRPIASITKLMTAMGVLDEALPLQEVLQVDKRDGDMLKHSSPPPRAAILLPPAQRPSSALLPS